MTKYDEWDDIYGNDDELEEFGCVLGCKCMMPSPLHFPSECHTAEDYKMLGEDIMDVPVTLPEAHAAIVAMMQAHGISTVMISADGENNILGKHRR